MELNYEITINDEQVTDPAGGVRRLLQHTRVGEIESLRGIQFRN
jgi:hypothetical protein